MISETKHPDCSEPQWIGILSCCAENNQTQTQRPPLLDHATPPTYGHAGFEQEGMKTYFYVIDTCDEIFGAIS